MGFGEFRGLGIRRLGPGVKWRGGGGGGVYSVSRPLFVGGLSLGLSGKGSLLRAYDMVIYIYIYIYVHLCINEYLKVIERGWKGERETELNIYIYIYILHTVAQQKAEARIRLNDRWPHLF